MAAAFRAFTQPREAADWLPIIVLLALGITLLLLASPPRYRSYTWTLAAAFTLAVSLRLLSGNQRLSGPWSAFDKIACLALLTGVFASLWLLLAAGGEEQPTLARWFFVVIVSIVTAVVLALYAGVLVYGQACGALAAALSGAALACISGATGSTSAGHRLTLPGFNGAAAIITFSLGSLILLGHFFALPNVLGTGLLLISLAAAGGPLPATVLALPAWLQWVVRAVTCLLPLAGACLSSFR